MKLTTQKRMAADTLGVGLNKVSFDPLRLDEIKQAITKADIQDLIKDRAIRAKPGRKKIKKEHRKRKKSGRIKMTIANRKRKYIFKIRKIRRYVKDQMGSKMISKELADEIRKYAKAGQFKSLRNVKEYIKLKKGA